ncbi:hypothetical protein [Devosia sp.]|uniref:hypothetical protein n=1 Tax=Devosia sp. TaxID=1871048 RepID=UPI002734CD29|nr:hypothetical protein [Devosia sp.]MDP2781390.1 hypothetical protein [Devosia sp.]
MMTRTVLLGESGSGDCPTALRVAEEAHQFTIVDNLPIRTRERRTGLLQCEGIVPRDVTINALDAA